MTDWGASDWTVLCVWFYCACWLLPGKFNLSSGLIKCIFLLCDSTVILLNHLWLRVDPGGETGGWWEWLGGMEVRWGTHLLWVLDSMSSLLSWDQQSREWTTGRKQPQKHKVTELQQQTERAEGTQPVSRAAGLRNRTDANRWYY